MRNLFQKLLLIQSILITNIIILIGNSSHLSVKESNIQYTLKSFSEEIEANLAEENKLLEKQAFINDFLQQEKYHLIALLVITFLFVLKFNHLKTNISYNIQPKLHSSTL